MGPLGSNSAGLGRRPLPMGNKQSNNSQRGTVGAESQAALVGKGHRRAWRGAAGRGHPCPRTACPCLGMAEAVPWYRELTLGSSH